MKLIDLIQRPAVPAPWTEGEKIPWNDPDFSARMLKEHLSQEHDAASRRFSVIEQHVAWLHNSILEGKSAKILDLGCGPGFYAQRLAQLGHRCVGIDFSPASIAYAQEQAASSGLDCTYHLGDIRTTATGSGFSLVMNIYGELNVFHPDDVRTILRKAYAALKPGGTLVLEPHTFDAIKAIGKEASVWSSAENGLFSPQPHLYLQENFWDEDSRTAMQRYFIIDAATGEVSFHASTMQAYTNEEYIALLEECGFANVEILPSLGNVDYGPEHWLLGISAVKS
ncbi:MAG: class I SAM-dependent methyltransferase [Anaerolineae bacterium]|jgi:SAM-dependent methyltransferase|nr:class I SAM-dependent methyltransferase [Anaerolineae bacterium]